MWEIEYSGPLSAKELINFIEQRLLYRLNEKEACYSKAKSCYQLIDWMQPSPQSGSHHTEVQKVRNQIKNLSLDLRLSLGLSQEGLWHWEEKCDRALRMRWWESIILPTLSCNVRRSQPIRPWRSECCFQDEIHQNGKNELMHHVEGSLFGEKGRR